MVSTSVISVIRCISGIGLALLYILNEIQPLSSVGILVHIYKRRPSGGTGCIVVTISNLVRRSGDSDLLLVGGVVLGVIDDKGNVVHGGWEIEQLRNNYPNCTLDGDTSTMPIVSASTKIHFDVRVWISKYIGNGTGASQPVQHVEVVAERVVQHEQQVGVVRDGVSGLDVDVSHRQQLAPAGKPRHTFDGNPP